METTVEGSSEDKLPMVVYLRGDEDIVSEFNCNAEQAMDYLGIKRSRLTQISGRELRVGRIRIDRYVRPVYRQQDLVNYRAWTRATASHQSASRAIEGATAQLENFGLNTLARIEMNQEKHTDDLYKRFKENFSAISFQLDRKIDHFSTKFQSVSETFLAASQKFYLHMSTMDDSLQDVEEALVNLKKTMVDQGGEVTGIARLTEKNEQKIAELNRAVESLEKKLEISAVDNEEVRKKVNALQDGLQSVVDRQFKVLENQYKLEELFEGAYREPTAVRPRKKPISLVAQRRVRNARF